MPGDGLSLMELEELMYPIVYISIMERLLLLLRLGFGKFKAGAN